MARSIQTIIDGMDAEQAAQTDLSGNEEQNFDHDNVQVYIQDYTTIGNDNQTQDTTTATLTPIINATINTIDEI